jgi:hypothetical protein
MAKGSISAKESHSMTGSKYKKNEVIWNFNVSNNVVSRYKNGPNYV